MAQWKHGWIPLTSAAARKKNHGRAPKPGSSVAAVLAKAKRGQASGVRSTAPSSRRQPSGRPSSSEDVAEARKAIADGNPARAVNLLTRAYNSASSKEEKAAIKRQRDELARKLMGRR